MYQASERNVSLRDQKINWFPWLVACMQPHSPRFSNMAFTWIGSASDRVSLPPSRVLLRPLHLLPARLSGLQASKSTFLRPCSSYPRSRFVPDVSMSLVVDSAVSFLLFMGRCTSPRSPPLAAAPVGMLPRTKMCWNYANAGGRPPSSIVCWCWWWATSNGEGTVQPSMFWNTRTNRSTPKPVEYECNM